MKKLISIWLIIVIGCILFGLTFSGCRTRKVQTQISKTVDQSVSTDQQSTKALAQDSAKTEKKDNSIKEEKTSEKAQIKVVEEWFEKPGTDGVTRRKTTIVDVDKRGQSTSKTDKSEKEVTGSVTAIDQTATKEVKNDIRTDQKVKDTTVKSMPFGAYLVIVIGVIILISFLAWLYKK